jgi:hypothetical protein
MCYSLFITASFSSFPPSIMTCFPYIILFFLPVFPTPSFNHTSRTAKRNARPQGDMFSVSRNVYVTCLDVNRVQAMTMSFGLSCMRGGDYIVAIWFGIGFTASAKFCWYPLSSFGDKLCGRTDDLVVMCKCHVLCVKCVQQYSHKRAWG